MDSEFFGDLDPTAPSGAFLPGLWPLSAALP